MIGGNMVEEATVDKKGRIVIVAGFQGITDEMETTTLGRGGSDTSAVALAAALKAQECEIFTDVDGIYTTDPKIFKKAVKMDQISYDEMLDEIVGDEFIRYKIHFLTKNVPMSVSDLAKATGLKPSEVLNHIVDMRRKNMLAVDHIEGASPVYKALEI
jgi:aspartate kinase